MLCIQPLYDKPFSENPSEYTVDRNKTAELLHVSAAEVEK